MPFDWDEANIAHIAKHGVEPDEAEEVISNNPIDLSEVFRNDEQRTEQVGETNGGRILRVVTTLRNDNIRVITAIPLRSRRHAWYFALKEKSNARNENIP